MGGFCLWELRVGFFHAQLLQEWFEKQKRHFSKQTLRGFQSKRITGSSPCAKGLVSPRTCYIFLSTSQRRTKPWLALGSHHKSFVILRQS